MEFSDLEKNRSEKSTGWSTRSDRGSSLGLNRRRGRGRRGEGRGGRRRSPAAGARSPAAGRRDRGGGAQHAGGGDGGGGGRRRGRRCGPAGRRGPATAERRGGLRLAGRAADVVRPERTHSARRGGRGLGFVCSFVFGMPTYK